MYENKPVNLYTQRSYEANNFVFDLQSVYNNLGTHQILYVYLV